MPVRTFALFALGVTKFCDRDFPNWDIAGWVWGGIERQRKVNDHHRMFEMIGDEISGDLVRQLSHEIAYLTMSRQDMHAEHACTIS